MNVLAMCGVTLIFSRQEIGRTLQLGGPKFCQDGIRQNINFDQFKYSIAKVRSIASNLEEF